MDFFDTRYFRVNKLFLSFIGLWPYQTPFMKVLTLSFAIFGVTIMCVPQIVYLFEHLDDVDNVFELMPTTTGTVICAVKIISLTRNSEKFKELLQQTYEDWDNLMTSQEMKILTRYAENGRKFTLMYSISIIGFVFCYALLPLVGPILDIISPLNETRPKKMPHPGEYFVNQEKYYYVLLLNTYVGYVACVSIAVAADTMYVLLVEHICGMYGILSHRLENLTTHDELQWNDNDYIYRHDEIGRRMRYCIQLHERIRLFIEMIESTFALFLFFDVGLGFLLHTSSCVMIVIRMGRSSEIVRYVALVLLQSCRLFFNSWAGQEVTDHSAGISIAAYNGIWYNAPVEVQKLLMLLIARSQKASRITIAKLYVINLEGFSTVMRTSISYCTVMISLRETSERLWPYQTSFIRTLRSLFTTIGVISMCGPTLMFVFTHPDNLDRLLELMPIIVGSLICGTKFANLLYHFESFKSLLQQIRNDWNNTSTETKRIFKKHIKISWKFTSIYAIAVFTSVTSFALLALINPFLDIVSPLNTTRPKRLVHSAEFLVDQEKYYYTLLMIIYYGYMMNMSIVVAIDTLYFTVIEHACAMFDVLSYHLENVTGDSSQWEVDHVSPSKQDTITRHLIHCVRLHLEIKAFIELIQTTFTVSLFFEVGLGFMMHCTLCMMMIVRMDKSVEFIVYIGLIICQDGRLFLFSWIGQQIIDHSIGVYIAAYNGMWYETSKTAKKLLLILIAKSQTINEIKVAKSFVMNLEGFIVMMKASLSYCTVMLSVHEESSGT